MQQPQETIMLFYSDHCFACRQLLQEVDRQNVGNKILRTSVDLIRAKGQRVPPQIHSVPAVYVLPSKALHFGKQAFDYLLNLRTGKIHELNRVGRGAGIGDPATPSPAQAPPVTPGVDNSIQPYSIGGAQFSDNYVFLSGTEGFADHGNNDQITYAFASLDGGDPIAATSGAAPASMEAEFNKTSGDKPKKLNLDMDAILNARRTEEQNFLGTPSAPSALPAGLQPQKV